MAGNDSNRKRRRRLVANQSENCFASVAAYRPTDQPRAGGRPSRRNGAQFSALSLQMLCKRRVLTGWLVEPVARRRRLLARYGDRAIYVRRVSKRRTERGSNAEEDHRENRGSSSAASDDQKLLPNITLSQNERRLKHAMIATSSNSLTGEILQPSLRAFV